MSPPAPERDAHDPKQPIRKRILQVIAQTVLLAAILLLSSGRLDWGMAWLYLGAVVTVLAVNGVLLLRADRALVAERSELIQEGTKGWDKILTVAYALAGAATLLVAGLDKRLGWTASTGMRLSFPLQVGSLLAFLSGSALATWAMVSNAYFASTVRLQPERGHAVCSDGPYRMIRHPGYSGWILCNLTVPVILGTLWAFVPAAAVVAILLLRTVLEDKMLRSELPGYEAYSRRVPYWLVPGLW